MCLYIYKYRQFCQNLYFEFLNYEAATSFTFGCSMFNYEIGLFALGILFFSQWLSLWSSEWRKSVEHFKEKVIMNIECQYNQHSCPGSYEAACSLCLWVLCSLLIWSNCNNCQTGVSALIMFWAWLKHKTQINMFTSQNPFLDHPDTWIISVVSMVVHQWTAHVDRNYFDWA